MKLSPKEYAVIQCALEDYREKRLAAADDQARETVEIIDRLLADMMLLGWDKP